MARMNDGPYFSPDREGQERSPIQLRTTLWSISGELRVKCSPHAGGLKEWRLGKGVLTVGLSCRDFRVGWSVALLNEFTLAKLNSEVRPWGICDFFFKPDHWFLLLNHFSIWQQTTEPNDVKCTIYSISSFWTFILHFIFLQYKLDSDKADVPYISIWIRLICQITNTIHQELPVIK